MLKIIFGLFAIIGSALSCSSHPQLLSSQTNSCVQFSVSSGTGCQWMCNYCSEQLGTNNYYFTDNVCTYQQGQGCVGNPIAQKTYTCCSAGDEVKNKKLKKEKKEKKKQKEEF